MSPKSKVQSPKSRGIGSTLRTSGIGFRAFLRQAVFLPNLGEALPFAVVVAEDVDRIALAQPAVQLGEELAPLRLRHLRLRRPLRQRTERLQALEVRSSEAGVARHQGAPPANLPPRARRPVRQARGPPHYLAVPGQGKVCWPLSMFHRA